MERIEPAKHPRKGVVAFTVAELLIYIYTAAMCLPVAGYLIPGVAVFGIVGTISLLLIATMRYKRAIIGFGVFSVGILSAILMITNDFSGMLMNLYGQLQRFLFVMIGIYFCQHWDTTKKRRFFLFLIGIYVVTAMTTYIGNMVYPGASRLLATLKSSDAEFVQYIKMNIGGFAFIYELVLLTPLVIYLLRSKQINRILGIGLLVLFGATIFIAEYTTALLAFFMSVIVLFLPKLKTKHLVLIVILLFLMVLFVGEWIADFFDAASEQISGEVIKDRFQSIAQVLRGEEMTTAAGQGRMEAYEKSLQTFWNTNGLGSWKNSGIGGHSFALDAMGKFGIVGLALVILVMLCIYWLTVKPCCNRDSYPYSFWIYLVAVLLMIMNPKIYEVILLCLLPIFHDIYPRRQAREEMEL